MNNMKNDTSLRRALNVASHSMGSATTSPHVRVLNAIGSSIVRGDLVPGDPLPNADDWSAAHGVSRTVLREVIKVLAGKGLVESRTRVGTRVRDRRDWNFLDSDVLLWRYSEHVSVEDARSLFELRRAIEPTAGALAAMRADQQDIKVLWKHLSEMDLAGEDGARFSVPDLAFHQALLRMSGNELIGSLAALIETALTISFRLTDANPRGHRHSLALHRAVVTAIERRDAAMASSALSQLLDEAEEDVRAALTGTNP